MYHTGCDIHSKTTQVQHMDSEGNLGLSMSIPTTQEGFCEFFDQLHAPTSMTIEASRGYWWVHQFLTSHPKVTTVNVIDPRRGRNLAEELSLKFGYGRAKNDRIDAEMAAHFDRLDLAPTIHVPTQQQLKNRSLVRHRTNLVWQRIRTINTAHALLAMHGISVKTSELLENDAVSRASLASLPDFVRLMLDHSVIQIQLLEKQISHCELALKKLLPAANPNMRLLMSAPGIGIVIAQIIHTEILDICYFKGHHKYLISYAGLAPMEQESAGKKGKIRLNRFSNHFLKYAFVEAAHHARNHAKYHFKYDQDIKKHGKIRAKLNLARRLTKAVYWMLARHQPFKG